VTRQVSIAQIALAGLALVTACTTDFTGYRLEADASPNGAASSVGEGATGGISANGGAGNVASDNAGTSSSDEAGEGGSAGGAPSGENSAGALSGGASSRGASAGTNSAGASGSAASIGGSGGASVAPQPSCVGLTDSCGADRTASCCAASLVPAGTYARSNLVGDPATLSAFTLDDYEVTVGRFRQFVQAFTQSMTADGAGKNPNNLALDPGWSSAWNAKLPADSDALSTVLQCASGTFTPEVGANESEPVTCVNWYEADAFCIWDGGRLPSEAEWNYAAAAGPEERTYPWGATVPDATLAVFCPSSCSKVQIVGSKAPVGDGKWGQSDLLGNAWEWNLDVFANPYAQASCVDCANTSATSSSLRVFRGGSAGNVASTLQSAARYSRDPTDHNGFIGLRCARNP
jgi:sulfatase modifying factor 1